MASEPSVHHRSLERLGASWRLALAAEGKAPRTMETYLESLRSLRRWCVDTGASEAVEDLDHTVVRRYLADELSRNKPSTASVRYRSLRLFFAWLVDEGELHRSPMANIKPPAVPVQLAPVLSDDELRRLLKVTSGRSFEQRRDHAILMVLIDTGIRRAELAGMCVDDVDLSAQVLRVVGKGGRGRAVAIGVKTTRVLDRYLRARDAHPTAHSDRLWLGARGPMSGDGMRQMLERRARDVGLSGVHAHAFRHGFAHAFLAAGGNETDLRELAGWRSPQMVYRYAASTRSERARQSHKRYGPGDRL